MSFHSSRRLRAVVFRLAAVMIGLSPFLVAEGVFALFDWGRPEYADDPFVGFSAVHPLFVLNDDETRWEIPLSRQGFFRPESFAANKRADEFRIFCLGGSTVQGRPFAVETSFTTWLELNLQTADPSKRWEVVNCGGVSYAGYRLTPILEEVLAHEADLVVIYTGHNEFLEDRTYRHVKQIPGVVARPAAMLSNTRTYRLASTGFERLAGRPSDTASRNRPILEGETDAILEYRGGMDQYHRDDRWRDAVVRHFHYSLGRMVQMTRRAGVDLILVNPVCNLRDCPPFKTQHRDGLTPEELRRWEALCREAGEHYGTDSHRAAELLRQAIEIDDQHAGAHYLLAKCYDAAGNVAEARRSYIRAKELDVCPLRILEAMNESILSVAARSGTAVVDVRRMFEQLSEAGIPSGYLLLDHVHPSIAGHQLIADALTDELVRRGVANLPPDWKQRQKDMLANHLESLDDMYFAKGQQRLERLRGWTQGKAEGVRREHAARRSWD